MDVVVPDKGIKFHTQPHRVYLSNKSGYFTKELFKRVMEEFTSWWRATRPGLDCFLISDNLRVHTSEDIAGYAKSNGIHMYNIMPRSSHWFQNHDQKSFGSLKKIMREKKIQFLSLISILRTLWRDIFACIFYQAEAEAFEPDIVSKTLTEVGLLSWNPEHILKLCKEHCSSLSNLKQDLLTNKLTSIIDKTRQEKTGHIEPDSKRDETRTDRNCKKRSFRKVL